MSLRNMMQLWRLANRPDENLGAWCVGPSPQKITHHSAIVLLDRLVSLDAGALRSFADLGSGQGLVAGLASARGAERSYAVEMAEHLHRFAEERVAPRVAELRKLYDYPASNKFVAYNGHIEDMKSVAHFEGSLETIYCFDLDFLEPVLCDLIRLVRDTNARWFVSGHRPTRWRELIDTCEDYKDWWSTCVQYKGQVPISLCGGKNERHTLYIYEITRLTPLTTTTTVQQRPVTVVHATAPGEPNLETTSYPDELGTGEGYWN